MICILNINLYTKLYYSMMHTKLCSYVYIHIYCTGKGDANIRYYELSPTYTELYALDEYKSNIPCKGMCILPKYSTTNSTNSTTNSNSSIDYMSCEINRLLKLTSTSIEPISFYVPRKATTFQEDLYPPVYNNIPPHSMKEWIQGSELLPDKVSLNTSSTATAPTTSAASATYRSSTSSTNNTTTTTNSNNNTQQGKNTVKQMMTSKNTTSLIKSTTTDNETNKRKQEVLDQILQAKRRIYTLEMKLKSAGLRTD